jgi:hypothetical protein
MITNHINVLYKYRTGLGVWLADAIHTTTWNPSRCLSANLWSPSCACGASTPTPAVLSLYVWTPWRGCYGCCCTDWLQRRGGCYRDDHKEETIVIDYFLYTDVWLHWIAPPTLLSLLNVSSWGVVGGVGRRRRLVDNETNCTCVKPFLFFF